MLCVSTAEDGELLEIKKYEKNILRNSLLNSYNAHQKPSITAMLTEKGSPQQKRSPPGCEQGRDREGSWVSRSSPAVMSVVKGLIWGQAGKPSWQVRIGG